MNDSSPVDLTQPDMLQKLDKYMKPLIRPYVYKWAVTQVTNCVSESFHVNPSTVAWFAFIVAGIYD